MLKIILGVENAEKYIDTKEHRFVRYVSDWFNHVKKEEWFDDPFVQKVIREIDNAEVACGSAVRSLTTHHGYSADHLSGGAKYLIMLYEYMDKPHRFLVTMGDNCTGLLEQIVKMYEAKGLDTIIVADYFYRWNYDVLGSVYFYNWDVTVHNEKEAYELAFRPWFDYNEPVREEQTEEEEDAELEMIGKDIERRLKLRDAKH